MNSITLIKAHISGFGIYQDYDIDFNRHLNSYLKDNGVGKSTLMDFIKIMFYGMETIKGNDYKERAHYAPLALGQYGGSLDFSITDSSLNKESMYHIERSFDEKSEAKDSLILISANSKLKKKEAQEKIIELIGVSKATYLKSLYLNNEPLMEDKSLKNVLTDTLHNQSSTDYTKLTKRLDDAITSDRRTLNRLEQDINEDELWLKEHEHIDMEFKECQEAIEQLKNKQNSLQKELNITSKQSHINETFKTRENLQETIRAMEELNKIYPYGYPTHDLIKNIKDIETKEILGQGKKSAELTDNEIIYFNDLDSFFRNYPLNEEKEDQEKLIRLSSLKENGVLTPLDEETVKKVAPLKQEDIDQVEKAYQKRNNYETNISVKKSYKLPRLIVIIAVIIIILGVTLGLLKVINPLGWILVILGVIGLGLAMFIYFNMRIDNNSQTPNVTQDNTLREVLSRLNLGLDLTSREEAYLNFKNLLNNYNVILKKKEQLNELENEYNELNNKINNKLQGRDYEKALNDYQILKNKKELYQTSLKEQKETLDKLSLELKDVYRHYSLPSEKNSHDLEMDLLKYEELGNDKERFKQEYQDLINKYHLEEKEIILSDIRNIDDINSELEMVSQDITDLSIKKNNLNMAINNKNDINAKLEELKSKRDQLVYHKTIVEKTLECFNKANSDLANSFLNPIQNLFKNKIQLLSNALEGHVTINDDLEFILDKKGQRLCFNQLSSGEKTIVCLALRLCVIDVLFKDTLPFLILDDPFMALDKNTLAKALVLIKGLSQQVLYFTCHESRALTIE